MDESGHPHPNDQTSRPVLVTACFDAKYLKSVKTELVNLRPRILNLDDPSFEMNAEKLITPSTFRNRPEKRELVESFSICCAIGIPLSLPK